MNLSKKSEMLKIWLFALTKKEKAEIASALDYKSTRYVLPYLQNANKEPLKDEYVKRLEKLYPKEKWDRLFDRANNKMDDNSLNSMNPDSLKTKIPGSFVHEVKNYKYVCAGVTIASIELLIMSESCFGCQAKLTFNEKTVLDSQRLFYDTANGSLQGIILEIEKCAIKSEHVQKIMELDRNIKSENYDDKE